MEEKLARQIRALQVYAAILTIAVITLAALYLRQSSGTAHFKQLDAERINIVENDGKLRMVISNQQLQHPGMIDGKEVPHRDRDAGMIFFNEDGDECGGMGYDGTKAGAAMYYSIDQYKNDQIMQLQYLQSPENRTYGLKLWDRPDDYTLPKILQLSDSLKALHDSARYRATFGRLAEEGHLGHERLFVGKTRSNDVGLFVRDKKGNIRLRIGVDSLDQVFFQAFDSTGKPIHPASSPEPYRGGPLSSSH